MHSLTSSLRLHVAIINAVCHQTTGTTALRRFGFVMGHYWWPEEPGAHPDKRESTVCGRMRLHGTQFWMLWDFRQDEVMSPTSQHRSPSHSWAPLALVVTPSPRAEAEKTQILGLHSSPMAEPAPAAIQ